MPSPKGNNYKELQEGDRMAAIKQRKGKKNKSVTSEDAKEDDKIYNADKQSTRKSGEVSFGTMLLFMAVFLSAIGCNLYYFWTFNDNTSVK